jgi:hypothetical protein
MREITTACRAAQRPNGHLQTLDSSLHRLDRRPLLFVF